MRLDRYVVVTALSALAVLTGCEVNGKVEQGRVIAYDKSAGTVTLIRETWPPDPSSAGVLPPAIVKVPADPVEMGPAPAAGRLLRVDAKSHRLVVFDGTKQEFRTIEYTPMEQRRVARAPSTPPVDRNARTISVYSPVDKTLITFRATDELMAMPADTWKAGDVVRYYYKQPDQALRLMNVTKTDVTKAGA